MKFSLLLILTLSLACASFVTTGCNSTPVATAVKTEGVIITTVDTGMRIWADQVNAGHATQSQVDTVKKAYNAYYDAQMVAKAAIEKVVVNGSTNTVDIATANSSVADAESALLSVLNQFITSK